MKLTHNGILFEHYQSAAPGIYFSTFTDTDGARLTIKTETLIRMYELVKFDLNRNGTFDKIIKDMKDFDDAQRKEYGE